MVNEEPRHRWGRRIGVVIIALVAMFTVADLVIDRVAGKSDDPIANFALLGVLVLILAVARFLNRPGPPP